MTRIGILGTAALLAAGFGYTAVSGQRAAAGPLVTVYKSPT